MDHSFPYITIPFEDPNKTDLGYLLQSGQSAQMAPSVCHGYEPSMGFIELKLVDGSKLATRIYDENIIEAREFDRIRFRPKKTFPFFRMESAKYVHVSLKKENSVEYLSVDCTLAFFFNYSTAEDR